MTFFHRVSRANPTNHELEDLDTLRVKQAQRMDDGSFVQVPEVWRAGLTSFGPKFSRRGV